MDATLTIRAGRSAGKSYTLKDAARATIGRSEACDFQVVEEGVSRTHCLVENKGDRLLVTDLGSSNGTYVNDQPVLSSYLHDRDRMRVGTALIEVSMEGRVPRRTGQRTTLSLIRGEEQPDSAIQKRIVNVNATMMMAAAPSGGDTGVSEELAAAHSALQTLCRVGATINAEHDLSQLFETIADLVLETTGAERAAILVHDLASGAIEPVAARHKGGGQETKLAVSRTVVDEVLRKGISAISTDASADDRFREGQSIIMQRIRSVMCVPLLSKETVLGALYVDTTDAKRKFADHDLELLAAIGGQAGVAIERAQLIKSLEALFLDSVGALAAAIEARDPYTRGHSERVTAYGKAVAEVLNLAPRDCEIVEISGKLHDVGKIGVPEAVLNKPGKLTDEEFEIIKRHPAVGDDIVRNIGHRCIGEVSDGVRHHHERWDGKGYPDGQAGDDICLTSRILAVADTYDAMTSDRPYRKGFASAKAMGILKECAGTQHDPVMIEAFIKAEASGAIAEAAKVTGPARKGTTVASVVPAPATPTPAVPTAKRIDGRGDTGLNPPVGS